MAAIENRVGRRSQYRTAWMAPVAGLAAVGVASAFTFIPLSGDVIVLVMVAALYGLMYFSLGLAQDATASELVVRVVNRSLRAALTVLAVCGYFAAVGAATVLLLLVVAGSSPRAMSYFSEAQANRPESAGDTMPRAPTAADLSVLPIEELCLTWRHSFTDLRKSVTDKDRLTVVGTRDGVLSELEHRDPQAFADWLDSEPRAAGDPTPYFTHQTGHGGQHE